MARPRLTLFLWGALCCLLAPVASQNLSASDTLEGPFPTGDDQLQLSPPSSYAGPTRDRLPRINLVNLTSASVTKLSTAQGDNIVIHDSITYIAPNTTYSISDFSSSDIAIIPCDPAPGFLQPLQAVEDAISRSSPAIILYSATRDYCDITTGGNVPSEYVIYSTTNSTDWQVINSARSRSAYGGPPLWYIGRRAVLDNVTVADNNNGPPFGGNGSPSTAVAMIILYSITGVITALFLIIIVTGAIRAHRHPERYGPRNVLGRPRQSRAKGLARAMLDTIPIVKFGEREEDRTKPVDVELANNASAPSTEGEQPATRREDQKVDQETSSGNGNTTSGADKRPSSENAPAAAAGAAVASSSQSQGEEEALGCSICTEDFERGQDVRVLPCHHSFHPACIDPWLLNVSGTCPLCRIDLRPANERENDGRPSAEGTLPPPLDAEGAQASGLTVPPNHRASRRLSGFITDILNPSRMQQASREERIAALRRLREHRNQSVVEEAETRRRRRLTARLGETFGVRTRPRGSSPAASGESPVTTGASESSEATAEATRSVTASTIPEGQQSTTATTSSRLNND